MPLPAVGEGFRSGTLRADSFVLDLLIGGSHPKDTMLDFLVIRAIHRVSPALLPAATWHRRGLAAAANGWHADADRWFEAAAAGYRRSLSIEPLARLRVHQSMVRARAEGDTMREAEQMLTIVRGLNRLDQLESFDAPHALLDAREVLASWLDDTGAERLALEESQAA